MKFTSEPSQKFVPIEVTILIESQAEANAIYGLFGTSCVCESVKAAFGVVLPYDAASKIHHDVLTCDKLTRALQANLGF